MDDCRAHGYTKRTFFWSRKDEQDEQVTLPSTQGGGLNCFALLARDNRYLSFVTEEPVTADWIRERLDRLSLTLGRLTVVVLDNAGQGASAYQSG